MIKYFLSNVLKAYLSFIVIVTCLAMGIINVVEIIFLGGDLTDIKDGFSEIKNALTSRMNLTFVDEMFKES